MFKDNIFMNPQGWAVKAVGTSLRYRFMQVATVLFGVLLVAMLVLVAKLSQVTHLRSFDPEDVVAISYVSVTVFVFIFVVAMPLCYLKALRHYVEQSQTEFPSHSK